MISRIHPTFCAGGDAGGDAQLRAEPQGLPEAAGAPAERGRSGLSLCASSQLQSEAETCRARASARRAQQPAASRPVAGHERRRAVGAVLVQRRKATSGRLAAPRLAVPPHASRAQGNVTKHVNIMTQLSESVTARSLMEVSQVRPLEGGLIRGGAAKLRARARHGWSDTPAPLITRVRLGAAASATCIRSGAPSANRRRSRSWPTPRPTSARPRLSRRSARCCDPPPSRTPARCAVGLACVP